MSEQPQFLYHYLVRSVLFGSPRHSVPVDHGGTIGPCIRVFRIKETDGDPDGWRVDPPEWVRVADAVPIDLLQFEALLSFGLDERLDLWSGGAEMIARRMATEKESQ